jgi:hypothetical protein
LGGTTFSCSTLTRYSFTSFFQSLITSKEVTDRTWLPDLVCARS